VAYVIITDTTKCLSSSTTSYRRHRYYTPSHANGEVLQYLPYFGHRDVPHSEHNNLLRTIAVIATAYTFTTTQMVWLWRDHIPLQNTVQSPVSSAFLNKT